MGSNHKPTQDQTAGYTAKDLVMEVFLYKYFDAIVTKKGTNKTLKYKNHPHL